MNAAELTHLVWSLAKVEHHRKGARKHTNDSVSSMISRMISSLSSLRNASIPDPMHACRMLGNC